MIDFPGIDDYFGAVGAQIWKTETINKEVVKYTWLCIKDIIKTRTIFCGDTILALSY